MTGDAQPESPGLPRRREPGLGGLGDLCAFTVDSAGRVTSWPDSAARLSGRPAEAIVGHDVREVLLTGPGQRELARRALTEVAAGRVWTGTATGGCLGDCRVVMRWEPLGSPAASGEQGRAMVTLRWTWPQPSPRWLADAAIMIGGTLDLGQTAAEIAELAVPAFADAVSVYVAEHLLAADEAASVRSGRKMAVRCLAGRLSDGVPSDVDSLIPAGEVVIFDPGTPGFRAMTSGQPVLFGWPGRRYTSYLAMPLTARGAVVGCVIFGRTTASPPFHPDELPQAEELAVQAAVRIDNAQLCHRERRTVRALQQGLLPRRPDAPPGIEIAARYLPVGSNVIGGDWHDVIALPGGRAAIVVGDAMGHGPEAAAAMAQIRAAAYVLADLGLPPGQLLHRLDRMVAEIAMAPFATCVCAVMEPPGPDAGGWSCAASRAGHPPPMVFAPGGEGGLLDLPAGLPLGLDEESFEETLIRLPAGATLAFYTDGLVESRARPIDEGLAELRSALSAALAVAGTPLGAVCATVAERLARHGEDDITLVLARIRGSSRGS